MFTRLGMHCTRDARSIEDIQAAVKFASKHCLRQVAQNTGHTTIFLCNTKLRESVPRPGVFLSIPRVRQDGRYRVYVDQPSLADAGWEGTASFLRQVQIPQPVRAWPSQQDHLLRRVNYKAVYWELQNFIRPKHSELSPPPIARTGVGR